MKKYNTNKFKSFIFDLIRYLFWKDYDVNEDFRCSNCGKEFYKRQIYCSVKCSKEHEEYIRKTDKKLKRILFVLQD